MNYAHICTRSNRIALHRFYGGGGCRAIRYQVSASSARLDVRRTASTHGPVASCGGTHARGQRATCVDVKTVAKTSLPAAAVRLTRKRDSPVLSCIEPAPGTPGGRTRTPKSSRSEEKKIVDTWTGLGPRTSSYPHSRCADAPPESPRGTFKILCNFFEITKARRAPKFAIENLTIPVLDRRATRPEEKYCANYIRYATTCLSVKRMREEKRCG